MPMDLEGKKTCELGRDGLTVVFVVACASVLLVAACMGIAVSVFITQPPPMQCFSSAHQVPCRAAALGDLRYIVFLSAACRLVPHQACVVAPA
jgi:hypothetical protein